MSATHNEVQFNQELTVLGTAARTDTTVNSDDQDNAGWRGVILTLDITAKSGTTPTLDVKVQTKDPASGNYVDLAGAAFAQKNDTFTGTLTIYPGVTVAGNVAISELLGRTWRTVSTIGGSATPTFTYSIGACYLK